MAQHFLLSSKAKTLSLGQVLRMSERQAETLFKELRWSETGGEPVCPHCGSTEVYECRRPNGASRYRCKHCKKDFSVTSGTLFASHKLPLKAYLAAIIIFVNEVKGKSALAMSRDLGLSYKSAFVLCHKLREAMSEELKGRDIGDKEETAEVDGAVFGGYKKPANFKENRVDRRLLRNQTGKRKWVVVLRERDGETLPGVFPHESSSISWIKSRVQKGTTLHADEASSWNDLHTKYVVKRINHQEAYSDGNACTNLAESFFSRMRRMEIGHHHHIAGPYLKRYAQEAAWREDNRRVSNGDQVQRVVSLAMGAKPSVDFCGYWQRNIAPKI